MTEDIMFDTARIKSMFGAVEPYIDDLYEAVPSPPDFDGGEMGGTMALIVDSGIRGAYTSGDAIMALMALVREAMLDFQAAEDSQSRAYLNYQAHLDDIDV